MSIPDRVKVSLVPMPLPLKGGLVHTVARNQGNTVHVIVSSAELGGRFKNMQCAVNRMRSLEWIQSSVQNAILGILLIQLCRRQLVALFIFK